MKNFFKSELGKIYKIFFNNFSGLTVFLFHEVTDYPSEYQIRDGLFHEKKEFINFLNKDSFNPHNLFFCKNNQILKEYYNSLFNWLDLCENKFCYLF